MAISLSTATIAAEAGFPDVLAIETAGLKAWPAHEEVRDGSWVRRASGGYSKRANSVQSLEPADDSDVDARLDAAAQWFEARSVRPVFRVTPLAGPAITAALNGRGWEEFEPTQVMVAGLSARPYAADPAVEVTAPATEKWLAAQQCLQGYDEHKLAGLRGIVSQMAPPAFGLVLRGADGEPLASAYMACADGMGFLGTVVTAPNERRKGHARRVVETALALAAEAGATTSVLQVLAGNEGAQRLYDSLGYRPHYRYHHRRPT